MTTTKPAQKTRRRDLDWTYDTLRLTVWSDNGVESVWEMSSQKDVIEAIRSKSLDRLEVPVAGAFACALAARSLLHESPHDYYSRFLNAARAIKRTSPGHAGLTDAIKRVLAAGDRADGPMNGPERLVEAIEAEAIRIHKSLSARSVSY